MSAARTIFTIIGSPALYAAKLLILANVGYFCWMTFDPPFLAGAVMAIVGGFTMFFITFALHDRLFGFRYGSWTDDLSKEQYISHYEGSVTSGLFSNSVSLKPKVTSDAERGNKIMGLFVLFDIFVFAYGGQFLLSNYPHLLLVG